MKVCCRCKDSKPESAFQKRNSAKDGLNPYCRACYQAYAAEYHASPAGNAKRKTSRFLYLYGITYERYIEMLEEQNGVCAICLRPETALSKHGDKIKALAIDHHHDTGVVRGLLCQRCNIGYGHLPSAELLASALAYALQYEARVQDESPVALL